MKELELELTMITVCENIKKFSERLPVSISCTVTEENVDTIDEMIDYAYRFGAISVKYSPVIMVEIVKKMMRISALEI